MTPNNYSRRSFLAFSAMLPWALSARTAKSIPTGLELYSVRNELKKDPEGTVRAVAKMGYQCVEFYAPYHDWTDVRRAWFGAQPIPIAYDRDVLQDDLGIEDLGSARLIDVAIRAAPGTGAAVRTVPSASGPEDGIGAILRWS